MKGIFEKNRRKLRLRLSSVKCLRIQTDDTDQEEKDQREIKKIYIQKKKKISAQSNVYSLSDE